MTSWNEFRANERAKISIWQVPPASSPFNPGALPPGLTSEQATFLTAARQEGPRLVVPWTDFTIFGDHRGAQYSNIVNDLFEGTPLTGGKVAGDGFLFVVYYPSADIVWLRFVHVNDEATMPIAYNPRIKERFRFYLNGIPTSTQILAATEGDYPLPPMSFGEEFFLPIPSSESEYISKVRTLRRAKTLEASPEVVSWVDIDQHPDFRDTIYYKNRMERASTPFRGEGSPTWSASIDPSTPWPAEARGEALWNAIQAPRSRSAREMADDYATPGGGGVRETTGGTSPYLYAKPVRVRGVELTATFESAATGREKREEIEVYTLDTSAGDYALLYTARNSREILRFYTAGPTIVTPSEAPGPDLVIPTFSFPVGDGGAEEEIDLVDLDAPPAPPEDPDDFLPPGGTEEDETSSGLTGPLPLILGAGAAAAYFLLNR